MNPLPPQDPSAQPAEPQAPAQDPLVDGHLDLAFNAVGLGRDLTLPLDELRAAEGRTTQTAMVTWPELRAAGIDLIFGTLFANPAHRQHMQPQPAGDGVGASRGSETVREPEREAPTYRDAQEAHDQARAQLDWYRAMEADGWAKLVTSRAELAALRAERAASWDAPVGVVVLMEGADPVREPAEVGWWWEMGVRIIGPAWQATRYAGGTRAPGPLSSLGRDLVDAMAEVGMALDVSHLADESLRDVLERFDGALLASHSNARALVPTDRHLNDDTLRALGERDAVVGLVLGNPFLDRDAGLETSVGLRRVGKHFDHVRSRLGKGRVGIGSDFDGGFGAEETPVELTRAADFVRLGEAVKAEHRASFLGTAWWAWLERALPAG